MNTRMLIHRLDIGGEEISKLHRSLTTIEECFENMKGDLGADLVFAWPTAEIAVMGAEGAVKIIYRREIETAADPKTKEAELVFAYRERFASPYQAAANALITDVINPSCTRFTVALALRKTLSKRETRPPKKHGNIPL